MAEPQPPSFPHSFPAGMESAAHAGNIQEKVSTEFSIGLIISKVDFTEPWIMALVAFHCSMFALCVATKARNNVQVLLFTAMLILVYLSNAINDWAALNWNRFSKQQYFDSQGFFISTVYSVPLLLNCLFMIGQWLYQARDLMVDLRKVQLRTMKRRKDSQLQPHLDPNTSQPVSSFTRRRTLTDPSASTAQPK